MFYVAMGLWTQDLLSLNVIFLLPIIILLPVSFAIFCFYYILMWALRRGPKSAVIAWRSLIITAVIFIIIVANQFFTGSTIEGGADLRQSIDTQELRGIPVFPSGSLQIEQSDDEDENTR